MQKQRRTPHLGGKKRAHKKEQSSPFTAKNLSRKAFYAFVATGNDRNVSYHSRSFRGFLIAVVGVDLDMTSTQVTSAGSSDHLLIAGECRGSAARPLD